MKNEPGMMVRFNRALSLINKLAIMALAVIVFDTTPVKATLIDVTGENYATDLHNGLDWLDLLETRNARERTIEERQLAGGDLEGWRLATAAEFTLMVTDMGAPVTNGWNSGTFSGVSSIMGILGATWSNTFGAIRADAYLDELGIDTFGRRNHWYASLWTHNVSWARPDAGAVGITPNGYLIENYGWWMVRDAHRVPEPNTSVILTSGLVWLVIARRKRPIQ